MELEPLHAPGEGRDLDFMVDEVFLAYNSARLREASQLFANRMLDPDVTIGMSICPASLMSLSRVVLISG